MPSGQTYRGDGSLATKFIDADVKDMTASDVDRKMRSTNLGSLGKKGKGPMPKQADYPSSAAWSAALRTWRETPDADVDGAKKALSRLGSK